MNFFSNRAFAAFTVALGASMWALFTDIGRPYLPSVPIIIYALYLYANRSTVGRLGGDALKDSPYFLGFLLTMFALFKIFNDVSAGAAAAMQSPSTMTQEVGGAVLTTIVGLFCRQALLSLIQDETPVEDDRLAALANSVTSHAVAFEVARQQFFRQMAEERARQADEFRASQEQLLARLEALTLPGTEVYPVPTASVTPQPVAPVTHAANASVVFDFPAGTPPSIARPVDPLMDAWIVDDSETASSTTATRTAPYGGPAVQTPPSGRNAILPAHPPYFGEGRASGTVRGEE